LFLSVLQDDLDLYLFMLIFVFQIVVLQWSVSFGRRFLFWRAVC